jgi:hypothetical protein
MCGRDYKSIQNFKRKTWREMTTWETGHRWKDNIKMDLTAVGYEDVN